MGSRENLIALLRSTLIGVLLSLLVLVGSRGGILFSQGMEAVQGGAPPLDSFGGIRSISGRRTGFYHVEKFGNRWMFVTPEGHPFWMLGVYNAVGSSIEGQTIDQKYGGAKPFWAAQRNRRLLSWGFNTLGEYASSLGLPVDVYGGSNASADKMPFILMINASTNAMKQWASESAGALSEPVKDIMRGVPSTYRGWRASFPDVYDPKFGVSSRAGVAYWMGVINGGFANKPWVLGITPDDADDLFGFKSRAGAPINAYPHNAWLIAVSQFQFTPEMNPAGRPWADSKNYTKYAWIEFLKAKYKGDIAALNSAWDTGGFYTAFDDAGGFGSGRGVIDEDGRHSAWMGTMRDPFLATGTKPFVQADLDAFLYEYAKKYAQTVVGAIRAVDKNHLIFGPAALNNYGAKSRDQVLRGLSDGGIDVFQFSYDPVLGPMAGSMAENNQSYDLLQKPAFLWYSVTAQRDSAMASRPTIYGQPDVASQSQRGQYYATDLEKFLNARGSNGDYYVVGMDWWELVDNPGEGVNWGLLTRRDNAYDGKEAVRAKGKDPWGFSTGGEERDCGDFLSSVRKANAEVFRRLSQELSSTKQAPKSRSGSQGADRATRRARTRSVANLPAQSVQVPDGAGTYRLSAGMSAKD
jgi:hypothetical protein